MKVGSLVELIDDNWSIPDIIHPMKNNIYTIRDIGRHLNGQGVMTLLLEEIHNNTHLYTKKEYSFRVQRFRELQSPMDISELIKESLTELA